MTEKDTPESSEKIHLTGNKKLLVAWLVTLAVGFAISKLLERREPVEEIYLTAIARREIEPLVDKLPEKLVEPIINADNNVWKRRSFIERALKVLLGSKKR